MKNGKLEPSDIGKRFVKPNWIDGYVTLIHITRNGDILYETESGYGSVSQNKNWMIYEEQKQKNRIEAAPAVFLNKDGKPKISSWFFYSLEEAIKSKCNEPFLNIQVIKWPADFDKEKGVWFYEYEEE